MDEVGEWASTSWLHLKEKTIEVNCTGTESASLQLNNAKSILTLHVWKPFYFKSIFSHKEQENTWALFRIIYSVAFDSRQVTGQG